MPSILIQDVTPRNQYTATMTQTIFVYDFTLFDQRDIEVYKRTSAAVDADDYTQKLQLNIDYTVDLVGSTITLLVACSGGEILTLVRNMPDERLNLYTNGTVITADALNTDQESSVLMIQQNSMYDTVLAPHYNKSEIVDDANPLGGDVILPRLTANQVWVKDPTNNFITTAPFGGGGGGGGGVVPAVPGVTGNPNSIAVWNNIGILDDSNVLMIGGNITNLSSISFQDLQIAVVDSHTINSINGQDLTLSASPGQNVDIASTGQQVTLSGLNYPTADGTAGFFITTDGAGNLSWAAGGGGAPFASTKYNLVQFSNTTGGLQDSGIDYQAGVLSGPSEVLAGNLSISGNTVASTDTNGNINLTPDGTGVTISSADLQIRSGNELRFYRASNAFYTGFQAGSPAANVTWTLPDVDGTVGQSIVTDGAGTLSFASAGGGGGGAGLSMGYVSTYWYPSGSVFGGTGATTHNTNRTTGTLYFHPIFITKTTTFTSIGVLSGISVSGTSVLGIYNDSGNAAPTGNPIANSNSTSLTNVSATFSSYTFGTPITLTAGIYWLAHASSAVSAFIGPTSSNGGQIGGRGVGINNTPSLTTIHQPAVGWSQSFAYSATLPSVGTLTSTVAYLSGDVFVFLQAQ